MGGASPTSQWLLSVLAWLLSDLFAFSLSRTDIKEEARGSPSWLGPDREVCREHSSRASRMLSVDFMG